jgi:hypothetical protein
LVTLERMAGSSSAAKILAGMVRAKALEKVI